MVWECIQALESSQIKSRTIIQTESQTDGDVDSKGRNLRRQRRPSAFQRALYHFRLSQSQLVQNWQTWQTTPPDPFPQSLSLYDQYPMIHQAFKLLQSKKNAALDPEEEVTSQTTSQFAFLWQEGTSFPGGT